MDGANTISDAGLYTDFSELAKLRTKASSQSKEATKEVAKQFESLFLQMMLKSMRDAMPTGESAESDQTRFYQEMFDKQIALDLANNEKGYGLGLAAVLEKELGGTQHTNTDMDTAAQDFELIRNQIQRSTSSIQTNDNSGQE
jgi:flagellar protein FlgJ